MNTKWKPGNKLKGRSNFKMWLMELTVILRAEDICDIIHHAMKPATNTNYERAWNDEKNGEGQHYIINSAPPDMMATLSATMTPKEMFTMLYQNYGHVGE
ncbi:hypothetical protein SARC_11462 [Sphaeroforma arctica JP610]|uniref:Uncharacterized protein n=1 Tax=Sphaeroforma arctica JP610 TaxID=667725 RepID=A0A0L0FJ26_9EUKA|nr:hypothetical protein SARC_11462 [Sphaeroforma arctica JP610]KNC76028.1 hypothetical protein SARC_11462 [Sphaeroforma arctica JP610]|eukprot:XP_014149930.1 hypothetical protein SARC_11462 [Sphaeroforma arctica JP610]